jgi:hypothetical protein
MPHFDVTAIDGTLIDCIGVRSVNLMCNIMDGSGMEGGAQDNLLPTLR